MRTRASASAVAVAVAAALALTLDATGAGAAPGRAPRKGVRMTWARGVGADRCVGHIGLEEDVKARLGYDPFVLPRELVPPSPPLRPSASSSATSAAAPSSPARTPSHGDVDTLAEESALIGRARANLASSPGLTLAAVDEHARRFPRGELAPEREYLRVSSLRRLGRNDEARARGRGYLSTYPSSPYAPSVRRILAELAAP